MVNEMFHLLNAPEIPTFCRHIGNAAPLLVGVTLSHLPFPDPYRTSHLPFANAQKVHQTDSNPGPHD